MRVSALNYKYKALSHVGSSMFQLIFAVLLMVLLTLPQGLNSGEVTLDKAVYYYKEFTLHWGIELVLALLATSMSFIHIKLAFTCWKLHRLESQLAD